MHGETCCLENAGRLPAKVYKDCTMVLYLLERGWCEVYDVESVFDVFWGNVVGSRYFMDWLMKYKIPRVVVGENETFMGEEELLKSRGMEVVLANDKVCYELMQEFIKRNPTEWNEDIGEW